MQDKFKPTKCFNYCFSLGYNNALNAIPTTF